MIERMFTKFKKIEENPKLIWFFIFLYMTFIFYLSSLSYPPQPVKGLKQAPIIEHIIEFGILGILLVPGFRSLGYYKYAFLFSLLFGISYSISDELHQYFVPGRYAELLDVFLNSVGVFLGAILVKFKLINHFLIMLPKSFKSNK